MNFDWSDLAFASKKPVSGLKAVFIAAPRDISEKRFMQLVKQYLPMGNIVLGLAKEPYILGFDDQPQFRTLQLETVQKIIDKVNESPSHHKIYTLHYFQREQKYILEKLHFSYAVFVNGSWKHSFHLSETYYTTTHRALMYECVSPFTDEDEAKDKAVRLTSELAKLHNKTDRKDTSLSEVELLQVAHDASFWSFDHSYQTGVALARKSESGTYDLLATAFNKVVPYQTYAWHHGPLRETNFSPANDLNYYDAVHAEVEMLVKANEEAIDFAGTSLFINLLPCPTCSRMLSETKIQEFVYTSDHSDGYAIKILEAAGKTVRRVVV